MKKNKFSIFIASIMLALLLCTLNLSNHSLGYLILQQLGLEQYYNLKANIFFFFLAWFFWYKLVKDNCSIWVNWVKVALTLIMLVVVLSDWIGGK